MFIFLLLAGCGDSRTAAPPAEPSNPPVVSPSASDAAPEPADDRPVILAFGDSLTAGSGLPPGSGYPEMLQSELDNNGYRYRVINAGIGGETTGGGVARLQGGLDLHPEIVILELGGNDGLRGAPINSMQRNLEELIVGFQKGGAKVLLAGMTLPRNYGAEYIGEFEKVYPSLAKKHSVTLIPFFLEGVGGNPALNLGDGIHPNAEGYRIVTQVVWKYLEPLLKKG